MNHQDIMVNEWSFSVVLSLSLCTTTPIHHIVLHRSSQAPCTPPPIVHLYNLAPNLDALDDATASAKSAASTTLRLLRTARIAASLAREASC